jgi:hypothetical protein
VPSPRLLDAGAELVAAGVPLERVLDEAARLRSDLDRIAKRFVSMYVDCVWAPYEQAGRPPDELPRITDVLNRIRPLGVMAVGPLLAQAMAERVNQTAAETLTDAPAASPRSAASAKR